MITGPIAFHDITGVLLTAAVNAINASAVSGLITRVCIVPGEAAWDECDCGILVASVNQMYLSDNFPSGGVAGSGEQLVTSPCRAAWAVADITFTVLRCVPTPQDTNPSVPCNELTASALVTTSDGWIMMNTMACVLQAMKDTDDIIDYVFSNLIVVGPSGGCVGSSLTISVAVDRGFA